MVRSLSKKERTIREKKQLPREDIVLVEFKAPKELVQTFDLKFRSRFSSRSEAIRYLMRMFVDEPSRVSERS